MSLSFHIDRCVTFAVPGARLLDDIGIDRQVEHISRSANALAVHDIELSFTKWWSQLVFHDLAASSVTQNTIRSFDGTNPSNVNALRSVKFQGITARCGFWIAKHDTDLQANLINEEHDGLGFVDATCQLTERLRHQACLKTYVRIPHVTFELGFWHEGGNGVDHQHVDCA